MPTAISSCLHLPLRFHHVGLAHPCTCYPPPFSPSEWHVAGVIAVGVVSLLRTARLSASTIELCSWSRQPLNALGHPPIPPFFLLHRPLSTVHYIHPPSLMPHCFDLLGPVKCLFPMSSQLAARDYPYFTPPSSFLARFPLNCTFPSPFPSTSLYPPLFPFSAGVHVAAARMCESSVYAVLELLSPALCPAVLALSGFLLPFGRCRGPWADRIAHRLSSLAWPPRSALRHAFLVYAIG